VATQKQHTAERFFDYQGAQARAVLSMKLSFEYFQKCAGLFKDASICSVWWHLMTCSGCSNVTSCPAFATYLLELLLMMQSLQVLHVKPPAAMLLLRHV
jgi:hypothetical protein